MTILGHANPIRNLPFIDPEYLDKHKSILIGDYPGPGKVVFSN